MTTQATERPTLTLHEIQALPAVNPAQPTICAVFGVSPATYYRLLAADDLPVPTFMVGTSRKVLRAEILRSIGEDPGDGAPTAIGTPLAETHHSTT